MTIELIKRDDTIVCKVPDQEETPLSELFMAIMFLDDAQIKKVFGLTKPEWKINFQPSEKEKNIDWWISALDKVYSR